MAGAFWVAAMVACTKDRLSALLEAVGRGFTDQGISPISICKELIPHGRDCWVWSH
jgi:hypothetical protein